MKQLIDGTQNSIPSNLVLLSFYEWAQQCSSISANIHPEDIINAAFERELSKLNNWEPQAIKNSVIKVLSLITDDVCIKNCFLNVKVPFDFETFLGHFNDVIEILDIKTIGYFVFKGELFVYNINVLTDTDIQYILSENKDSAQIGTHMQFRTLDGLNENEQSLLSANLNNVNTYSVVVNTELSEHHKNTDLSIVFKDDVSKGYAPYQTYVLPCVNEMYRIQDYKPIKLNSVNVRDIKNSNHNEAIRNGLQTSYQPADINNPFGETPQPVYNPAPNAAPTHNPNVMPSHRR